MDLRSGCTFWPELTPNTPRYGPLGRDLSCDVAILGGGITGALAAYHLTREGLHTVMLDRRPVGGGSTTASTRLLQYELDTLLVDLIELVRRDHALRAYRLSYESLDAFPELVDDLGDRCGLARRPCLYLGCDRDDVEKLKRECDARRSLGIAAEFLDERHIRERFFLFPAGGAVVGEGDGGGPFPADPPARGAVGRAGAGSLRRDGSGRIRVDRRGELY